MLVKLHGKISDGIDYAEQMTNRRSSRLTVLASSIFIASAKFTCQFLSHLEVARYHTTAMVRLDQSTHFERGFAQGRAFQRQIRELYDVISTASEQKRDRYINIQSTLEALKKEIPSSIMEEMEGLAQGANCSLDEVIHAHIFIDFYTGENGCSALATLNVGDRTFRIAATNHFASIPDENKNPDSRERLERLETMRMDGDEESHKRALRLTSQKNTIFSTIFIGNRILFAKGLSDTPLYHLYQTHSMTKDAAEGEQTEVISSSNLDWAWRDLVRHAYFAEHLPIGDRLGFTTLAFPGFIGVLRGRNTKGVSVHCCQSGEALQKALPITFVFRKVLEEAHSVEHALEILENIEPASSMNLLIAGSDQIVVAELDPERKTKGPACVRYPESSPYVSPTEKRAKERAEPPLYGYSLASMEVI